MTISSQQPENLLSLLKIHVICNHPVPLNKKSPVYRRTSIYPIVLLPVFIISFSRVMILIYQIAQKDVALFILKKSVYCHLLCWYTVVSPHITHNQTLRKIFDGNKNIVESCCSYFQCYLTWISRHKCVHFARRTLLHMGRDRWTCWRFI
jgi:hypothetical protein